MRLEKIKILLISFVLIATVTTLSALRGQSSSRVSNSKTEEDPRPVVDYVISSPAHNENSSKRFLKGKRYNGGTVQKKGTEGGMVTYFDDWEMVSSAIPVEVSDTVVVGTVLHSAAYLSPDTTGVYSEFTINLNEILKDRSGSISVDAPLTVDRGGGSVRYPSGAVVKHIVSGQGTPRVNRRYVLFLKHEEQGFRIITGYELGAGGINPLDSIQRSKKYKGVDEATFLNQIRNAINSDSSDTPEKGS